MTRTRLALDWQVGHAPHLGAAPANFILATVPGAVQLDWARAEGWPEPAYDSDLAKYRWMEDAFWRYRAVLPDLAVGADARLFFVCGGVDYRFQVSLNGNVLHAQEGMFTPLDIELTGIAKAGDVLEVDVFPAPKSCASGDRVEANQSVKPAVSYEWDFHPRLIPLGIWDETFLEVRPEAHMRRAEVRYELDDDLSVAHVRCEVFASHARAGVLHWQLTGPDGVVVIDHVCTPDAPVVAMTASVNRPQLWWPNGQGAQVLYTSTLELRDAAGALLDVKTQRVGFKRVRLVMHPAQWDEPEIQVFPKGRHTSPITVEINGRRVFAKGANWVSPDIFPGRITRETYAPLLELAHDSHFNMLRCWGGAIVQKEAFFDLCDELGLMVWQEFPLACNRYEGTPEYLAVLDRESASIIKRLRSHVSLALWCGGNELFNNWSKMTDQDLALRLLNRNCYDLDRERPFLMTSPMPGMAHGGYFFRRDDGAEVYQYFARSKNTAYTEYGVPGAAGVETLRAIIPAGELWPPRPGTQWTTRHAFGAWQHNSWLDLHTIAHYFGEPVSLEQMVEWSQWLQAEGYKAIFEEARRQKPTCAMALNWVLNEPWPTAANNSLVNWPAAPKPAMGAVAASCRDVLASARIPKFAWQAGEAFTAELWLLNDSPDALPAGRVEAWIHIGGTSTLALAWDHPGVVANTNLQGPSLRSVLVDAPSERLMLELRWVDHPERNSSYALRYFATRATAGEKAYRMGGV